MAVRDRGAIRWAVVIGLALLVAVVLAALVLQRPQGAAGGPPPGLPVGSTGGATARQAYPLAVEAAQAWQPDGRLAVASANWRYHHGRWPDQVGWTFQFYSPATRRIALVAVEEGRAQLLREALSPYPLPTFDEADWRVDSPEALEVWWGAGGESFMARHSEVGLAAQLRPAEGGEGRPVWTVTGLSGDRVWIVVVDGVTGERLQD